MNPTLLQPQPLPEPPVLPEGEEKVYEPEDLLTMPDGHRFELVDGKLVERNMGAESSEIAGTALILLGQHVRGRKLGKVFPSDCGYQIFLQQPKKVNYADVSFIARGKLPGEKVPRGHVKILPDLVVEVVSPNDTAEEVEAKRVAWLQAGVRLLWVIYPESRTVHVCRAASPVVVLTEADELTGDDVVPEFTCRVADLFAEG